MEKIAESYNTDLFNFTVDDVDIDIFDRREFCADILGTVEKKDIGWVSYNLGYDSDIDIEWEEDGAPTYVPYGDDYVLYDDGKGGIDSVSVKCYYGPEDIIDGRIDWKDDNKNDITEDDVKKLFDLSDEDYKELVKELLGFCDDYVKQYVKDNIDDAFID